MTTIKIGTINYDFSPLRFSGMRSDEGADFAGYFAPTDATVEQRALDAASAAAVAVLHPPAEGIEPVENFEKTEEPMETGNEGAGQQEVNGGGGENVENAVTSAASSSLAVENGKKKPSSPPPSAAAADVKPAATAASAAAPYSEAYKEGYRFS
jgi:hypothetical protein